MESISSTTKNNSKPIVMVMGEIKGIYGTRVSVPFNCFEIRDFMKKFDVWNSSGTYKTPKNSDEMGVVWFEMPLDSMTDGMSSKFVHSKLFKMAIRHMGAEISYE